MTSVDAFHEDLQWQAKRALELGRTLCACEGRHHWSFAVLRATGMTSIGPEEPLMASVMTPLIGDRARVMIAGSADLGLLCFVGRCAAARQPQITVIDRCPAPLALIDEFATLRGIACRTVLTNLQALDGREQWDVILAHHTAEFFDAPARARFYKNIAASLVPGGSLVCATMTGEKHTPDKQGLLEAEFRDHSITAFRHLPLARGEQAPEFERLLADYSRARAARRMGYPSDEECYDDFRNAGLKIVSEHALPVRWTFSKVDVPPGGTRKFVIVAKRE